MKRWVVYFALGLLFTACSPRYVRDGIKNIDKLKLSLDTVAIQIQNLDTLMIKNKFEQYMATIQIIKTFEDDHYTPNEWAVMTQYGQIRKPVRNFLREMKNFQKELEYSTNQLNNLRYDLKKRLLSKEQFNEYFNKEQEAISMFLVNFKVHYEGMQSQLAAYDTLYPKILKVIENHNNIHNNNQDRN